VEPAACGGGATTGFGGGALYTGRGPVCGTIILGGGATGAAGRAGAAVEAVGASGALASAAGGAAILSETDGADGGGGTARGGTATGGALALCGGLTTGALGGAAGGCGGRIIGAGGRTVCGVINRGAGAGGSGVAGRGIAGAEAVGTAAAGLVSTEGGRGGTATGRGAAGGAAAACCCCVISFKTSPGREMCDRSILVLISPGSFVERLLLPAPAFSAAALMCARTFSASKSSTELECVFFSVTPTSINTSRMALLFTSSSLARSLIRILLIRPFFAPTAP
jgi:hypothetical protein